ncbi:MAG TPA: ABC transporter substrate-binding protein [Rectinemataceae bacterium]|nr:ABC transporter substrate-binding protein [Rectinemataceae bacterium]
MPRSQGRRLFLACAVSAAAVLGCGRPSVTVGFVGPLTGSSSAIGIGCRNGFLMALGSGPAAAPGHIPRLRLLVKDDRNDAQRCLEVFNELKAEGCSIIVLGTPSQTAGLALPWAMDNGVLVISPTVSTPVPGSSNALFIRVNMSSMEYGIALAHVAHDRYGANHVGIVGDSRNASYVDAVERAFVAEYARLGCRPAFDRRFDSTKDSPYADLVAAIRSTHADGLLAVAASTEVVLMAKELEREGERTRLFLPPWPLTLDLIQNGGKAVEGVIAVSIADLEYRTAEGQAFEQDYRREYGEEPSFTAMFGYEAASILRAALASSASWLPKALRDRVIAIREFSGLQGPIRFDADGKAQRTLFLFTIDHGAFKRLD